MILSEKEAIRLTILEITPEEKDVETTPMLSYGSTVFSSLDRANVTIAAALKVIENDQTEEAEVALAKALIAKIAMRKVGAGVQALQATGFPDMSLIAEQEAVNAIVKETKEVIKNPAVKRTRRARIVEMDSGDIEIPQRIETIVGEKTAQKIQEVIAERSHTRSTSDFESNNLAAGNPKAEVVEDPFTELPKVEETKVEKEEVSVLNAAGDPLPMPRQPNSMTMDEFLEQQRQKLAALAKLSPDNEPSL